MASDQQGTEPSVLQPTGSSLLRILLGLEAVLPLEPQMRPQPQAEIVRAPKAENTAKAR